MCDIRPYKGTEVRIVPLHVRTDRYERAAEVPAPNEVRPNCLAHVDLEHPTVKAKSTKDKIRPRCSDLQWIFRFSPVWKTDLVTPSNGISLLVGGRQTEVVPAKMLTACHMWDVDMGSWVDSISAEATEEKFYRQPRSVLRNRAARTRENGEGAVKAPPLRNCNRRCRTPSRHSHTLLPGIAK